MPTTNDVLRERVWKTLINNKYKGYVIQLLYCKYQKWDRWINVFLAVISCGSIATWAVWKELPMLWAGLIALSQFVNAVKPWFPYNKYVKEFSSKSLKIDNFNIEYERLFNQLQTDAIDDKIAEKQYYDFMKEYSTLLRFSEDVIFDVSKQDVIEKKATELNKTYFRTHYNVELS